MYIIETMGGRMTLLIIIGLISACAVLAFFWKKVLNKDFFSADVGDFVLGVRVFAAILLGAFIANGINEAHRLVDAHHLAFAEEITPYTPYLGDYPFIPAEEEGSSEYKFCDADGNRITYAEGLQIFYDTHDFILDIEGRVVKTYPKGMAPAEEKNTRSLDCPYYLFNMTKEQQDAYFAAKSLVEKDNISRQGLYKKLTDPYSRNYPPEIADFAIEAALQNGKVDFTQECIDWVNGYMGIYTSAKREDVFQYLTGPDGDGFTVEEAEIALATKFPSAPADNAEASETPEANTASEASYLLPDSAWRLMTDADLQGLGHRELCLARNEIYARHGRIFQTPALSDYFNSQSWYEGRYSEVELSEIEKQNVDIIRAYEDAHFGGSYY